MKERNISTIIKKVIASILLMVVAFISVTVITPYFEKDEIYSETIASIDNKKSTVTTITLAADAASIAIAAIPGDATSPIAEKILDVTSYLVIVISALVLEKVLVKSLTIIAFKYLIPIVLAIIILSIIMSNQFLRSLGLKLLAFSMVVAFIIPISMKASDFVYQQNKESIEQVNQIAEEEEKENKEKNTEKETKTTQDNQTNKKSVWSSIKGFLSNKTEEIKDTVTGATKKAIEDAKRLLNQFIDSVAILILTTCVIPILVIVLALWLLKYLFGTTAPMGKGKEFFDKYKLEKKESLKKLPKFSSKE